MDTLYIALEWLGTNAWWLLLAFAFGYGVAHHELSKEINDLHAMLAEAERHEP